MTALVWMSQISCRTMTRHFSREVFMPFATGKTASAPANNIDLWSPGKSASVFIHPSGYIGAKPFKGPEPGSNGMISDPDGRVSVAGHARRNL